MTMKLASLPLALLAAAAGPALAQSVTLYGLVDTGIEVINEAGADGSTVVRMPTITGQSASRWGMRGSEDLGNGLKAVFVLESGLAPDTGGFQQGNRLFGRQLYVGLQGGWGTLTFGRQYSALLAGGMVDPFLASIYGPGSLDIYFAGPRMDNAIGYSGSFGPLSVGGTYSLGRDNNGSAAPACAGESPTDDKACRAWSAVVKYDTAGWGVGAWIDTQHGAGAQQNDTDTRSSLNGHVKLGAAKLILGVIHRDNEITQLKSDVWFLAGSYAVTPTFNVEAAYYDLNVKNSENDSSLVVLRANYLMSKRTTLYATVGHRNNDGTANGGVTLDAQVTPDLRPAAGQSQSGMMVGLRHTF
ncbi:porin [Aquariibacter albus]|nr:porin [Aquariibacter albus]